MFDLVVLHCVRDILLSSLLGAEPVLGSFVKSKQNTLQYLYDIKVSLKQRGQFGPYKQSFRTELAFAGITATFTSAAASDCAASLSQPAKCAVSTAGRWVSHRESREPSLSQLSQLSQPPFRNLLIKCSCSLPLLEPGNLCSFGICGAFVFDFWDGRSLNKV